jgi:hypothetical protein
MTPTQYLSMAYEASDDSLRYSNTTARALGVEELTNGQATTTVDPVLFPL